MSRMLETIVFDGQVEAVSMLPEAALIPLALFTALLLFVCLHVLAASGQFPREHRAPALASAARRVHSLRHDCHRLHKLAGCFLRRLAVDPLVRRRHRWRPCHSCGTAWYCRQFTDNFVDGRASLMSFAGAGAMLALLLIWLAGRW